MPSGISITRTSWGQSGERIPASAHHQRRWPAARALAVAIGLAFATAPRSARAADPPDARDRTLPCRPTIACTADFVPPGTVDLEAGALFRSLGPSNPRGRTSGTRQWTFPFLAKLTLEPWVQLQVGSNGLTAATGLAPQSYFDDVVVGLKFHLVDQTRRTPSISLSAEVSVPTFAGPGYVRTLDSFFTAYVTKDLGPVHADFNAGFNVWRIEQAPLSQALVALALTANVPPPFGVMGEAYFFSNAPPVAPKDGGLLFAFTHSPRPWLVFDLGADIGWFPTSRAYSLFFGMAIIPVVLWRPSTPPSSALGSTAPRGGARAWSVVSPSLAQGPLTPVPL
jgi:hypothetical protein